MQIHPLDLSIQNFCNTLHPEKLASKKFGYLACDRQISYI